MSNKLRALSKRTEAVKKKILKLIISIDNFSLFAALKIYNYEENLFNYDALYDYGVM